MSEIIDSEMSTDNLAGTGTRRRISINGENYYLIVTRGEHGPHICVTCPRENAPENRRIRGALEGLCDEITKDLREFK